MSAKKDVGVLQAALAGSQATFGRPTTRGFGQGRALSLQKAKKSPSIREVREVKEVRDDKASCFLVLKM